MLENVFALNLEASFEILQAQISLRTFMKQASPWNINFEGEKKNGQGK